MSVSLPRLVLLENSTFDTPRPSSIRIDQSDSRYPISLVRTNRPSGDAIMFIGRLPTGWRHSASLIRLPVINLPVVESSAGEDPRQLKRKHKIARHALVIGTNLIYDLAWTENDNDSNKTKTKLLHLNGSRPFRTLYIV